MQSVNTCLKKIAAAAAALMLAFGAAPADTVSSGSMLFAPLTVSADEPTINSFDVTIYAVDSAFKDMVTIPGNYPASFKIKVDGAEKVEFTNSHPKAFNVSEDGLITTDAEHMEYGDYTLNCTADDETFSISVHIKDYGQIYTDEVIDKYIKEKITQQMTVPQKLEKLAEFAAGKKYNEKLHSVQGMVIAGSGDSKASAETVIYMAKKLGLDGWTRDTERDDGTEKGQINAMVTDGSKYYEVDTGLSSKAARKVTVTERISLFSTREEPTYGGIEVYQYDGKNMPTVLDIPAQIDGKNVVSIAEGAFGSEQRVKEISLPYTLKNIGKNAFFNIKTLERINIPASIEKIESNPFGYCNKLSDIQCETGCGYTFSNGILYKDEGTYIVSAPSVGKVEIGSEVKEIGTHAFWGNQQLTRVFIPKTVEKLGDLSFGYAENLTQLIIEEGSEASLPMGLVYGTKVSELYVPESMSESYIPRELLDSYSRAGKDINTTFYNSYCVKTVMGFTGSYAEQYAAKYGLKFKALDKKSIVSGANLALGGNIEVNVYLKPSFDKVSQGAYAVITGPNDTDGGQKYVFRDHYNGSDTYKLSCELYASQMAETVKVQVFNANGTPVTLINGDGSSTFLNGFTYTVKDYIDTVEGEAFFYNSEADTKKLRELIGAMKDYGACAQKFFTDSSFAEDKDISDMGDVTAQALKEKGFEAVVKKSSDDVNIDYGYSLILKSETTLKVYYDLPDTEIESVKIRNADNTDVRNVEFGEMTNSSGKKVPYVNILDIGAGDLGNSYEIIVTGKDGSYFSVNVSPVSYVYAVLNKYSGSADNKKLCDVAKALYKYYVKAAEYFGN